MKKREDGLMKALSAWWDAHKDRIEGISEKNNMYVLRNELIGSFSKELTDIGLLQYYDILGTIAAWWSDNQYDFKTIAAQGFKGLIDSWVSSIQAILEDTKKNSAKSNIFDHRFVRKILPDYLAKISDYQSRIEEIETAINPPDDLEADEEAEMTPYEIEVAKHELREIRKLLKKLSGDFLERLNQESSTLGEEASKTIVTEELSEELEAQLLQRLILHRQLVISKLNLLWEKYNTSLEELRNNRDSSSKSVDRFLEDLGYDN